MNKRKYVTTAICLLDTVVVLQVLLLKYYSLFKFLYFVSLKLHELCECLFQQIVLKKKNNQIRMNQFILEKYVIRRHTLTQYEQNS